MSYCKKCGTQLLDDARFCGKCGEPTDKNNQNNMQDNNEQPGKGNTQKNKKKIFIILGVILILAALLAAVGIIVKNKQQEKQYESYILKAERYVEEMNYEKAEDSYLKAIEIDPKQRKPYLELAKVYIEQEEYEKAEDILEQAEENCPEKTPEESEDEEEIKDQIEERKNTVEYKWIVEPTIEADQIYYLQYGGEIEGGTNETYKQDYTSYAVIQKDNLLGLIDIDGTMLTEAEYEFISNYYSTCLLTRKEPIYISQYNMEWSLFCFENNEIRPIDGLGGVGQGMFYYFNGLHNTMEDSGFWESPDPIEAIPVLEAKESCPENYTLYKEWEKNLSEKSALYYKDELITDFIYDKCGTGSNGLIAVCQNGKWGYINEKGEIIIPIEYDTSWKQCGIQYGTNEEAGDFCYAASDGFVTLCKNGEWELRDVSGKIAIPAGIFEEILPVYEGKCWVKKDGKWGVIQLEDSGSEENDTHEENEVLEDNIASAEELSASEICERVVAYYEKLYDLDELVVFEDECSETDQGYFCILRNQGGNTANQLVTGVEIDIITGEVTDDYNNQWNIYDEK